MRKTVLFSLLFALLLLCACGGNTVTAADASLQDISAELQSGFSASEVTVLNSEYMLLLYGLDAADCAEATAFRVAQPITPSEIILVRAVDEEAQKGIQETLDAYLRQLRDTTREYDAESYAIAEKSRVFTRGLYSALIYDAAQTELEAAFTAHLKEYAPEEAPVFTPAPTPEPTPLPTAEPTPEPAPLPEEEPVAEQTPTYGLVRESARAADSWFDDTLLVGNSVLGNLKDYTISKRMGDEPNCMGKAVFMNVNTISYATAVGEIHSKAILPHLDGLGNCTVQEAIQYTGAKKVYLTMGYGDLVYYPGDYARTVGNCALLVQNIRQQCGEDILIFIVSVTPRTANFDNSLGSQSEITALNAALQSWCEESANRCYYVNAAEVLADESGHLRADYCVDSLKEGIHLTGPGSQAWMDYLYTHTAG